MLYEVITKTDLFYTIQNRERRYGYINFGDLNEIIPIDIIKNALGNLRYDKGLIVDLRRCGGGYLSCTYRVSELFYKDEKILFYNRITSYNVCYTKLLRGLSISPFSQ